MKNIFKVFFITPFLFLGNSYAQTNPGGIPGSILWLRADIGTNAVVDGDGITSWADQSGNGFDAEGTGDAVFSTTNAINGNPVIFFSEDVQPITNVASAPITRGASPTSSTDESTIFVVQRSPNMDDDGCFIELGTNGTGSRQFLFDRRYDSNDFFNPRLPDNRRNLLTVSDPGGSGAGNNSTIFLNSGSYEVSQNLFSSSWTTGSYVIGADFTPTIGSDELTGEIGEIIYFDYELTTLQRRRVESYLAIKYGITLTTQNLTGHTPTPVGNSNPGDYITSTNTLLWDASANLTYHNDVIGIGRDDGTALDQRRSVEFNENPAAETTLALEKSDISTPFTNDLGYVLTGHDIEPLAFDAVGVGVPTGIDQRSQRTWFVQTNGTPGAVTLTLTLGGSFLNTGNVAEYALLVDSDPDFSNGASIITAGAVLEGNLLTFPNVNFSDGDYFTLSLTPITEFPGNVASDLSLWLRADAGTNTTTNGTGITSWEDQSVNGSDAIGTGDAVYSNVNNFNFNPTISFSDDAQAITGRFNRNNGIGSTVFVVGELSAESPRTGIFEFGGERPGLPVDSNSRQLLFTEGYAFPNLSDAPINLNTPTLFSIQDQGNQDGFVVNQNNSLLDSETSKSGSFNSSFTNTSLGEQPYYYLGDDGTGDDEFTGEIAEVIYYDTELSITDRRKVESYLAVKYGITLDNSLGAEDGDYVDSDGITIWDASENATYHNDIIGIGRDDVTTLEQQKSVESSESTLLTIERAIGFEDNQDYLLIGNDNGGLVAETTGLNPVYTERIQRVWKVANTGDVNGITLSITLPAFATSTIINDYALLIDTDNDFSDSTIHITGASLVGNVLTFTDVDFPNNATFTIGIGSNVGPANVTSGLTHWFRADEGTSTTVDGANITTWENQRRVNNAIKNGTAATNYVESSKNFNPTVFFDDGDNGFFNINLNEIIGSDYSIISVLERDDTSEQSHFIGANFSSSLPHDNQRFFAGYRFDDTARVSNFSPSLNLNVNGYDPTTSTPDLFTTTLDTSSGRRLAILKDGVENTSTDTNTTPISNDPGTAITARGFLGTGFNPDPHGFQGNISEVIVYNNTLTTEQLQRIHSYLAIKYGLTLPVGTNYLNSSGDVIWDATLNSIYHNNIAGIGTDVGSNLLQKQSKSENLNSILAISKSNSIAISNNANPATFDDNLDFLIWGSDSVAPLALVPHDSSVNDCATQLNRNWRVSNSGNVDNVTLSFDISSLPATSLFNLVIDNDGNGNYNDGTIQTITTPTVIGTKIMFNNISLPDGAVFTLTDISTDFNYTSGVWFFASGADREFDDSPADLARSVTVNNDVTLTASHNCKCLRINNGAVVTVQDNESLTVSNTLTSNGSIYLNGDSELIQTEVNNTNSGPGKIFKIVNDATESPFRYNYFASPVNTSGSITLANNLRFNTGATLGDNTTPSFTRSFDGFGTTLSTRWTHLINDGLSFVEINQNESISTGLGFTMKGTGTVNNYNFIGSPNNGTFNVPITAGNFLLTGNPYPSTINGHDFNTLNTGVTEGFIYLWDQPAGDDHNSATVDSTGGYATIGAGMVVAAATLEDGTTPVAGATTPTEFIRPGQGFIVATNGAGGNVQLDNSLRVTQDLFDGSRHFFRTNNLQRLRSVIRLGFEYDTQNNKVYHRQLATALDGSSMASELGKDAFMFDYNNNDAYWILPDLEDRYIITSVPFASEDLELPVGVVVDNEREVRFKIDALQDFNSPVYLMDKQTNSITNIVNETYKVTLPTGDYKNRFSLVFNDQTLSSQFVDQKSKSIIYVDNDEIEITLEDGNVILVELFTITGKKVLDYKEKVNTNHSTIKTSKLSSQFYIIKIKTDKSTISKKIYVE